MCKFLYVYEAPHPLPFSKRRKNNLKFIPVGNFSIATGLDDHEDIGIVLHWAGVPITHSNEYDDVEASTDLPPHLIPYSRQQDKSKILGWRCPLAILYLNGCEAIRIYRSKMIISNALRTYQLAQDSTMKRRRLTLILRAYIPSDISATSIEDGHSTYPSILCGRIYLLALTLLPVGKMSRRRSITALLRMLEPL
ncbi:hypothetical protein ABKN59_002119 [Abortiporus biennis]